MRDHLIRYVDLLFAGAADAGDIKQEILQNTLDRYDDLVSQGKAPEAAYSLAIAGIGDVSELLGDPAAAADPVSSPASPVRSEPTGTPVWKKVFRAVAVFLYIICIIPLIVLAELGMEIIGLCGTLAIAGVATVFIILAAGGSKQPEKEENVSLTPQQQMRTAVKHSITAVGLVVYFIVSFLTQAWHITWLIFPIIAAAKGLVFACMDLKEAAGNEK